MTMVRIVKSWDWPDIMRQSPRHTGTWDGVQFTAGSVDACDYLVVLNWSSDDIAVRCPPEHVWAIMQEPPLPLYDRVHGGPDCLRRIYTPSTRLQGPRYVHSHGALPWHANRDYDELVACRPPDKPRRLSWVTSNLAQLSGHRDRLRLLARLRGRLEFDLWGRGFAPIEDKWDGLGPYRYSLAIENYSGPDYWSEKLADCYLSWTMPIYYGCTNLEHYFPPESYVAIDPRSPDVVNKIAEVAASDLWLRNRDAIAQARQLVLQRYQLFPFLTEAIHATENQRSGPERPEMIRLRRTETPRPPLHDRLVGRAWQALVQATQRPRAAHHD